MPAKYALIIANSEYQDPNLSKLTAPEKDAGEFARALRKLAGFDVQVLKNAKDATMRRAIALFFAERFREDLLLLYFSGHGLKNEYGRLFLAASDTNLKILDASAVPAEFVAGEMDRSRSKRQTLILDCCNSGAFVQGMKGSAGMGMAEAFQGSGYGRIVLTATDAVQYAWEANRVIGKAHTSLFTRFLIEGLQGAADLDGDGKIGVDELYEYAYRQVVQARLKQTPKKWTYGQIGGDLFLREDLPPRRNVSAANPPAVPKPPPEAQPAAPPSPLDEQVLYYNEGRALQKEGKLAEAAAVFTKVGDYRDAILRLRKLRLYLEADKWMQQGLADQEDRLEPWWEAQKRLEELLQLEPQFLDALSRLAIVNARLALPETYNLLLEALDQDDWAQVLPLFERIRRVKANYKRAQTLLEKVWLQMVEAGATFEEEGRRHLMIFVPAGEFVMGSDQGDDDEKPPHWVYLDDYYIDRYPVTNAEYQKFVEVTKRKPLSHWKNGKIPAGKEAHPVVNVSWQDAADYAAWAGKRLPTEAEWEKAASWDPVKREKRVFPWGDRFDTGKCNAKESRIGTTTPVGKYSPQGDSPYGVADMAGNVWEWCADWYDENYYQNSPPKNPQGPSSGRSRVLRGGSWDNNGYILRASLRFRSGPVYWYSGIGFRCVRSLP